MVFKLRVQLLQRKKLGQNVFGPILAIRKIEKWCFHFSNFIMVLALGTLFGVTFLENFLNVKKNYFWLSQTHILLQTKLSFIEIFRLIHIFFGFEKIQFSANPYFSPFLKKMEVDIKFFWQKTKHCIEKRTIAWYRQLILQQFTHWK